MKLRFLLHVIAPLAIGGAIYVCRRDQTLEMFDWFSRAGLSSVLAELRQLSLPFGDLLPRWLLYSLPDALWVYATVMFMDCIWIRSRSLNRRLWLAAGPLIVVIVELCQLTGLVNGTFDPLDLVLSGAATCIAVFFSIHLGVPPERTKKGLNHVHTNTNEPAVADGALSAAAYR